MLYGVGGDWNPTTTVSFWRWENAKKPHPQIAHSLGESEQGISFEMRAHLLLDCNCKNIFKMGKRPCGISSHIHWCKDVSWARCWGISIINPSKTIAIPHNESIKVPWSLLCAACADTAIVFPLISFPPKDLGLSRRYLLLRRNKSSVVPEQSVFIGRSNKSSERGGKERYGCLACRALSSAHCCASMSPPALHSFGTAKPLIAFVALIRAEVFLLGCLSFLPPSPFHLRQCIHIFICI